MKAFVHTCPLKGLILILGVSPRSKHRLSILVIGVGGYIMLNGILLAGLGLPATMSTTPEKTHITALGTGIAFAISAPMILFGNKYRKKAKAEIASQSA